MKQTRRRFIQVLGLGATALAMGGVGCLRANKRPNILLAIADDQSWPHTGAYGSKIVQTPAFDRVAREGILFNHGFCPAPQCSPARAALLTGKNIWQLEEAGTHASYFPTKFQVYPDLLEAAGYFVGYTGKPWSPGNWQGSGWKRNPVGVAYNELQMGQVPATGINKQDYAGNFEAFLEDRSEGQPFCFWYGSREPHRNYEAGSGQKAGKELGDAQVPPFLPDNDLIRSDLLDYGLEIDWFDRHLGSMIKMLESRGELDNTLIVVTADNGMPFPRAKANLYDKGIHVPLAIRWGDHISGGLVLDDFVSFIDFAPTFLEAAGLPVPDEMTGRSLMPLLTAMGAGLVNKNRDHVLTGRERHTHARPDNVGYPARSIRTSDYLYIRNFKPERWPAGDPGGEGYYDIDGSPSKLQIIENRDDPSVDRLFDLSVGKRPTEELYAIGDDPDCMNNLADDPVFSQVKSDLWAKLEQSLKDQGDPRMFGTGDIFDSYPRFSSMRGQLFDGFAERGQYNPKFLQPGQKVLGGKPL
ncbi:sulfatase [Candidatus Neomarinimicrobiota bacterium]